MSRWRSLFQKAWTKFVAFLKFLKEFDSSFKLIGGAMAGLIVIFFGNQLLFKADDGTDEPSKSRISIAPAVAPASNLGTPNEDAVEAALADSALKSTLTIARSLLAMQCDLASVTKEKESWDFALDDEVAAVLESWKSRFADFSTSIDELKQRVNDNVTSSGTIARLKLNLLTSAYSEMYFAKEQIEQRRITYYDPNKIAINLVTSRAAALTTLELSHPSPCEKGQIIVTIDRLKMQTATINWLGQAWDAALIDEANWLATKLGTDQDTQAEREARARAYLDLKNTKAPDLYTASRDALYTITNGIEETK